MIRVLLAALTDEQRTLIEACLERANQLSPAASNRLAFRCSHVAGRGIHVIERATAADVVLFGLEDDVLPGEASHIVATCPEVKIIGVDERAQPRVILGALSEPLSEDLPTVIRWITRRSEDRSESQARAP